MTQNAQMLKAALYYSEKLNFSVIPVGKDKKPLIKWEFYQKRKATQDEIRKWFGLYPDANIGIVTGIISNLAVVDIDTDEGKEEIQKYIPDSIVVPTCTTPKGGQHLYFMCPDEKLSNNARTVPGCDLRANGGYVVAPPSMNGHGKGYEWLPNLKITQVSPPPLPTQYLSYINNNSINYIRKVKGVENPPNSVDTFVDMFAAGRRDNDLFHVANLLIKGGAPQEEAMQVLKTIAKSWGEQNQEKWFSDKIRSALNRSERRSKSLSDEVKEWVLSTNGYFLSTEIYNCLQLSTREDKKNVSIILKRLSEQGLIEKTGSKHGQFRVVDNAAEDIDFEGADDSTLNILWPFEIERFVDTYPKSISIIAGAPNAGKTAFLLNFVKLNMLNHEISYFSSEMGKIELKSRLKKFDMPLSDWKKASWKERSSNFADVIKPNGINVIDFLELHNDFFLVGQMIKDIFDRLDKGIAVIALQKNAGVERGLGGFRSLEKARLYLAMDSGVIKIVKGKNWHNEMINPNGLQNNFRLVQGCKFMPDGWLSPEDIADIEKDKKYGGFEK